jgi:hypothetical protein
MKLQILASAAALALIAGGASAATHKSAGAYAPPAQPIAYSKLDTYLKASPREKATGNWGLDATATASAAPIGAAANTAATAPQAPMTPSAPAAADTSAAPAAPSQAAPDTSAAPAAPSQPDTPATPPASPKT